MTDAPVFRTDRLPSGLALVRHYRQNADAECGRAVFYQRFVLELVNASLEPYNQPDGTNKFLRSITLHIYAPNIPYPQPVAEVLGGEMSWGFAAVATGTDTTAIYARYMGMDPRNLMYRYPASLSHEFGHAYHNWCGLYQNDEWGTEFRDFLGRQFCPGGTYPQGWTWAEAFANTWRCLKGSRATRGVSGADNGGSDATPAEIVDPKTAPAWRKQLDLLPDTCAYAAAYGIQPGSLVWKGSEDGSWQFKNKRGEHVSQTSQNTWHRWRWSWRAWRYVWEPFSPAYTRT